MSLFGKRSTPPPDLGTVQFLGELPKETEKLLMEMAPRAIQIVHAILLFSIKHGASEIRIERRGGTSRVLYQLGGCHLREAACFHASLHEQVVGRFRLLAGLTLADPRQPQEGTFQIRIRLNEQACDFAFGVRCVPEEGTQRVVLRCPAVEAPVRAELWNTDALGPKKLWLSQTPVGSLNG